MTNTNIKVTNSQFLLVVVGVLSMCLSVLPLAADDCEPKRNCDATRNCSVPTDTTDCEPHWGCPSCQWYQVGCHVERGGCEADKLRYKQQCEAKKAANNAQYAMAKGVCEVQKAGEKLDCERVKSQMRLACEAGLDGPFSCSSGEVMSQLRSTPQDGLTDFDMLSGAVTTPFKKLGGQLSWRETDCQTSGAIAKPYRNSQRSSDGFCTIDVKLVSFPIDTLQMPAGNHYLRIEALPGGKLANTCKDRTVSTADTIQFGGPIKIDKHLGGHRWLEVHVTDEFAFATMPQSGGGAQPAQHQQDGTAQVNEPHPGSVYVVRHGDCLAKIAERAYGTQTWPRIFRANRSKIRSGDPNLIYPETSLTIP